MLKKELEIVTDTGLVELACKYITVLGSRQYKLVHEEIKEIYTPVHYELTYRGFDIDSQKGIIAFNPSKMDYKSLKQLRARYMSTLNNLYKQIGNIGVKTDYENRLIMVFQELQKRGSDNAI